MAGRKWVQQNKRVCAEGLSTPLLVRATNLLWTNLRRRFFFFGAGGIMYEPPLWDREGNFLLGLIVLVAGMD
jgi:hypothetical protein